MRSNRAASIGTPCTVAGDDEECSTMPGGAGGCGAGGGDGRTGATGATPERPGRKARAPTAIAASAPMPSSIAICRLLRLRFPARLLLLQFASPPVRPGLSCGSLGPCILLLISLRHACSCDCCETGCRALFLPAYCRPFPVRCQGRFCGSPSPDEEGKTRYRNEQEARPETIGRRKEFRQWNTGH